MSSSFEQLRGPACLFFNLRYPKDVNEIECKNDSDKNSESHSVQKCDKIQRKNGNFEESFQPKMCSIPQPINPLPPISSRPPFPLPTSEIAEVTPWENLREPEDCKTDEYSFGSYSGNYKDFNSLNWWDNDEEDIYSYAGQDIISPALAIRAQSIFKDEENIYEEISECWQNLEYDRFQGRRVLSALNINVEGFSEFYRKQLQEKDQRMTFSKHFKENSGSYSPDSGLTASASDSSGDLTKTCLERRDHLYQLHKQQQVQRRPKLKRCESLDMKDIVGRRPTVRKTRRNLRRKARIEDRGRKQSFKKRLENVREKVEKTKSKLMNLSKKGR